MAIFNTTIIISGIRFLILVSDIMNGGLTAQNDKYGLLYDNKYGDINMRLNVILAIQNKSLIGKFKQLNYFKFNGCMIDLFNKRNKSEVISDLSVSTNIGEDFDLKCHYAKYGLSEIRQQKMLRKIYRLSSKVNLFKKRLDRLTNKTL
jgi:hypothetical protein